MNNSNSSRQRALRIAAHDITVNEIRYDLRKRLYLFLLIVLWIFAMIIFVGVISILTKSPSSFYLLLFLVVPIYALGRIIKDFFPTGHKETLTTITLALEKEIYAHPDFLEKNEIPSDSHPILLSDSYTRRLLLYGLGFLVSLVILVILVLGAANF